MMRFAQPWLLAFGVPLVLFVLLRLRRLPPSLVGGGAASCRPAWLSVRSRG